VHLNCLRFLEQILERLSRVAGPQAGRSGRFPLPRDADFVKRAIVASVLALDPLWNWLHALEAASRIEVRALFARVQLKAALGAKSRRRYFLQNRAALRAA
jgi:hypothetical protein